MSAHVNVYTERVKVRDGENTEKERERIGRVEGGRGRYSETER